MWSVWSSQKTFALPCVLLRVTTQFDSFVVDLLILLVRIETWHLFVYANLFDNTNITQLFKK